MVKIRVTAILIKEGKILILEQNVDNQRSWSLPGGGLEEGESLEQALRREMQEETGLDVSLRELLYICDYIKYGSHVVHITFAVDTNSSLGKTIPGLDKNEIKSMVFVPVRDLESYGFSHKFRKLIEEGFPHKGSYMGDKANIGL